MHRKSEKTAAGFLEKDAGCIDELLVEAACFALGDFVGARRRAHSGQRLADFVNESKRGPSRSGRGNFSRCLRMVDEWWRSSAQNT